jgi:hypothetical protein
MFWLNPYLHTLGKNDIVAWKGGSNMDEAIKYNDLMMALVIAVTAFIGLTGVISGQISLSNISRFAKTYLVSFMILSILLGIVSLICAIGWFSVQEDWKRDLSIHFFSFQLGAFITSGIIFWFGIYEKFCTTKPVSTNKTPTPSRKHKTRK